MVKFIFIAISLLLTSCTNLSHKETAATEATILSDDQQLSYAE